MYALCSDAMLKAITRQAGAVDEKVKAYNATHLPSITIAYFFDHFATDEDTAVMVTEQDFIDAHKELVPSVSADELGHYERVRKTFEGAGKKEEKPLDKGKGKAVARPGDEHEDYVNRTENINLNGSAGGNGDATYSGKGKGKAPVSNHASKNSVDIAEGGFGDAAQDDDELYS
jgi:peroxin-6